MEGHIDARQRNSGKAAIKLNEPFGLLLLLSFVEARLDNVAQHFFDFV